MPTDPPTIINQLLEDFRGWVSPSGSRLATDSGEDHGRHANRILDRAYPDWDWSSNSLFTRGGAVFSSDALEYKGWVRVVGDGIYSVYRLTPRTISVLTDLILDVDDETPVSIEITEGHGRSISRMTKEAALQWLESVKPSLSEAEGPRIRGEYWITDGGVWFADGDVGDMNHEGYAIDHARRLILDLLNADSDEEFIDDDMFRAGVVEALAEEGISATDEDWQERTLEFLTRAHPEREGLSEILATALGRGDARDTAVHYFGWIWCRGNNFSIWNYDREQLLHGVNEVIEQEIGEPDVDWSQLDLEIFIASTRKHFSVTLSELESGRTPGHDPTWPVAEALIEELLGEGSGIFVKQLDNGRNVYTCKCPVCGTFHGGYRTQDEAERNKKCREHRRKEVEKLRKDIEKVDDPKKEKDLFKNPNHKEVLGNVNENEQEESDIESIVTRTDLQPGDVTKVVCENARLGQEFWHRSFRYADGSPLRVRVSGQCKTWESRPNEFRIPVRHGVFQTIYITELNANEFSTASPGDNPLRSHHPGGRTNAQAGAARRAPFAAYLE